MVLKELYRFDEDAHNSFMKEVSAQVMPAIMGHLLGSQFVE
jgi:hypothetical protein